MIFEKIKLKSFYEACGEVSELSIYSPSNSVEINPTRKRKSLLVLPGGAYIFCSDREHEPVALKFLANDFNVFVLKYPCTPLTYPHPLIDSLAALDYIKTHADRYNVDIDNISILGFSAGGHLCASTCLRYNYEPILKMLSIKDPIKPKACLLGYPVILVDENSHKETRENITLNKPELIDFYDITKHLTSDFPKTFIFSTKDDASVPIINSYKIIEALKKQNVYVEDHIYEHGFHGLSVCDISCFNEQCMEEVEKYQDVKTWVEFAINFLNR